MKHEREKEDGTFRKKFEVPMDNSKRVGCGKRGQDCRDEADRFCLVSDST